MINVAKSVIENAEKSEIKKISGTLKGNEKYLLVKRSADSKFFPEKWDFPGGKIKEETAKESVIRETKEETSLSIEVGEIVIEGEHIEQGKTIHYKIFLTKKYQGEIKISKEHSEYAWLTKKEIEKLETTPFVKKYFI